MKKRILGMLVLLGLLFSFNVQGVFANDKITVLVNGEQVEFDVAPIIENSRTLVPVRAIFEKLGAVVEWDEINQMVCADKKDISVSLQVGNTALTKNGMLFALDVPAKIVNDRTLVPLRAVSEAFDCEVVWNESTKTVSVTSPKELVIYEMVEETVVKKTASDDVNVIITYIYPQITNGKDFLTEQEVKQVNQIAKDTTYNLYDYDGYASSFVEEWGEIAKEENYDSYTRMQVKTSLTTSGKYGTISLAAMTAHPWMGITASAITLSKDAMYENDLGSALKKDNSDINTIYEEMFVEFSGKFENARYFDKEDVNYIISDDKLTFFMSSIGITGVGRYNGYYAVSKEY